MAEKIDLSGLAVQTMQAETTPVTPVASPTNPWYALTSISTVDEDSFHFQAIKAIFVL